MMVNTKVAKIIRSLMPPAITFSFSASRRRACLPPQEFFFERIAVGRDGRIADL